MLRAADRRLSSYEKRATSAQKWPVSNRRGVAAFTYVSASELPTMPLNILNVPRSAVRTVVS